MQKSQFESRDDYDLPERAKYMSGKMRNQLGQMQRRSMTTFSSGSRSVKTAASYARHELRTLFKQSVTMVPIQKNAPIVMYKRLFFYLKKLNWALLNQFFFLKSKIYQRVPSCLWSKSNSSTGIHFLMPGQTWTTSRTKPRQIGIGIIASMTRAMCIKPKTNGMVKPWISFSANWYCGGVPRNGLPTPPGESRLQSRS